MVHSSLVESTKIFAAKYGFKLTTSSPFYPKGHGYVERQIQSIKNLLKKCDEDKSDPHLTLLQLRTKSLSFQALNPFTQCTETRDTQEL